MANNFKTAVAARNLAIDAALATIGSDGFLDIYDGTQPTNPDTALGAQVKLAHLALSTDAFGDASSGTATAASITSDSSADATGTAAWFTLTTSGGTRKFDGSVGTSGADLNLNSVAISSGQAVGVSALTVSQAA